MKREILLAAERDLSDYERFQYCSWLRKIGMTLNIEHAMCHMARHDAKKAKRLVWC